MTNKIVLLSLSNDLKRICASIQRNSPPTTKRFILEAEKWLKNIGPENQSVTQLLPKVQKTLKAQNNLKKAEDCLMYSVLLQNRALKLD